MPWISSRSSQCGRVWLRRGSTASFLYLSHKSLQSWSRFNSSPPDGSKISQCQPVRYGLPLRWVAAFASMGSKPCLQRAFDSSDRSLRHVPETLSSGRRRSESSKTPIDRLRPRENGIDQRCGTAKESGPFCFSHPVDAAASCLHFARRVDACAHAGVG
jgi:hypothetical protein